MVKLARLIKYLVFVAVIASTTTYLGKRLTAEHVTHPQGKNKTSASDNRPAHTRNPDLRPHAQLHNANKIINYSKFPNTEEIQLSLSRCGFLPKTQVDKIGGPTTENAIKSFQSSVDIKVDGLFGPITSSQATKCSEKQRQ